MLAPFCGHSTASIHSTRHRDHKNMSEVAPSRTWMCNVCGFVYEESEGLPEDGIAPGTRWEEVPANWSCPECGARKEDFEMIEI